MPMEIYTGTQIINRYRSNVEFSATALSMYQFPISISDISVLFTAFAVGFSQASVT